jgi:uncharacterized protein
MNRHLSNHREPWVDGLRGLAILGVFIVNTLGYPFAPDYPSFSGMPQPLDSVLASVVHGLVVALIAGKAWSLLCLLLGYSLMDIALRLRAQGKFSLSMLRVRYWKLLIVGALHGALIYFGDILTMYALCALISSRWVMKRPRLLFSIFKKLSVIIFLLALISIVIGVAILINSDYKSTTKALDTDPFRLFFSKDAFTFWSLNMRAYFSMQLYGLFSLPLLLWLLVAGMLIRRFRLFSTRQFARKFWAKYFGMWQLIVALILNLLIGYLTTIHHGVDPVSLHKLTGIGSLSLALDIGLTANLVAYGMRHWHKTLRIPRWIIWLVPAGQNTLMMYLLLSISLALSNTAFLGLAGGTLLTLCIVVFMWFVAVYLARLAVARGLRDPITQWLSPSVKPN